MLHLYERVQYMNKEEYEDYTVNINWNDTDCIGCGYKHRNNYSEIFCSYKCFKQYQKKYHVHTRLYKKHLSIK